jgi:hypothetical protein
VDFSFLPVRLVRRWVTDDAAALHLNSLLSSLIVLAVLPIVAACPQSLFNLPHFCLIERLFHVPCPGCGVLRSLLCLARGDLAASIAANPAGLVIVSAQVVGGALHALGFVSSRARSSVRNPCRFVSGSALGGLVLSWLLRPQF